LTVKLVELATLPPFVVTAILPVAAPAGTVAVISESETTVNDADILSIVTFVV
jgi:hypothetical protein